MYAQSVPYIDHGLKALSGVLAKAEAHCAAKKIDPATLTTFRLFPDMLPFTRQVLIACDFAKGCGARLAAVEVPSFADTEVTFAELQARIEKTRAFLATLKPAQFDGAADRMVKLKLRGEDAELSGNDYLFGMVLPNFYFHLTTAYDILRHNGVELGKSDFMGR